MITELIQWSKEAGVNQWLFAIGTFLFTLTLFLGGRRILWSKLESWTRATTSSLDDILLKELWLPVVVLLVIVSFGVGLQAAPVSVRSHPLVAYGSRITFIALSVWILERVLTTVLRSQVIPMALASSTKTLLLTVSRLLLLSVGFLIAFDTVGISITPILASLGVGSVAVALALQDTLGNFFSGLYLLIDKPIRIGDFVKVDEGIEGHIAKIGWRSTHIQLLSNNTVVLPNSKIAASQLTNFDFPDKETAVLIQVGVSYECDLDHVERVTVEVAKEVLGRVTGGISTFEPFIRFHTFGGSSINFTVILRARQFTDKYLMKHEFTKTLHTRYRRENISIPFPQQVIHLRKEGSTSFNSSNPPL